MDYVIPQALAQAILDYLAAHPYREVHPFVQALQKLRPVEPPAAPAEIPIED